MQMPRKRWVSNVFRQQLVMFGLASATNGRVLSFQLFNNPWRKTRVNNVFRVARNRLRWIGGTSFPLPSAQQEVYS